jgi:DNA-binding transcriptional LysR family regulator
VRQQRRLVLRGRQQSRPRHSRTVTTDTDMSARSARATLGIGFLPELMARVSCRRRLR